MRGLHRITDVRGLTFWINLERVVRVFDGDPENRIKAYTVIELDGNLGSYHVPETPEQVVDAMNKTDSDWRD